MERNSMNILTGIDKDHFFGVGWGAAFKMFSACACIWHTATCDCHQFFTAVFVPKFYWYGQKPWVTCGGSTLTKNL